MPINVGLDLLDAKALERILVEPRNAIIKQYIKLFEMDDVKLTFEPEAIAAIAKRSVERKTGARGLRAIIESVMTDVMYEVPSDENISECIITKEAAMGEGNPRLVMKSDEPKRITTKKKEKENEIA